MRVWQKIYFVTLLLFLIMLNAGLFLAARFVFSYNLKQEQKKVETDCFFLCKNLEHDFSILRQNKRYKDSVIELLFEGYRKYYKTLHIEISLEQGEAGEKASIRSQAADGGRQMHVLAQQSLAGPYQNYRIYYDKQLLDFEQTWLGLKRTFAMISLAMSVSLCLLLYVFMRHMLKPLGRLNESVAKIAAGEYGRQMEDAGNSSWNQDEIAELARNVNKMSETIQRQIGALEEENQKKQRLMDNMAHELKTPLTSIYGYAEYLRYAKTDCKERYEGLAYIMEESMRLAKMSETMLSMRLYEKEEHNPIPVDLRVLARHVEKILLPGLQEKKISIRKDFRVETVFGDEELLVNLLRNLLENAIRASKCSRRQRRLSYPMPKRSRRRIVRGKC